MTVAETTRIEELRRRVQRDPASVSFAALAEEYRRLGRFLDAIETCRNGLLRHPSYMSARVTLGRALIETGEHDQAAIELEQVLRVAPENLAAIRALAEIHRRRAEMPESFESYELPPPVALASSQPIPVAVQSSAVKTHTERPGLAGLESFLSAIQRRRETILLNAR